MADGCGSCSVSLMIPRGIIILLGYNFEISVLEYWAFLQNTCWVQDRIEVIENTYYPPKPND